MRPARKNPEKWRTNIWFLLHDNAPAHRSVLAKDDLAKYNLTTLENPQHSPDLAAADFHLFPLTKWVLKGRCLCDATDVIKNATEELKRLLQNGFPGMLLTLLHSTREFGGGGV